MEPVSQAPAVSLAVSPANEEAIEAWDGVLFDRFVQFRHIVTTGLGAHGDEAMRIHPPRPSERVVDLGCGFGDTSQQLAKLVGPEGSVLGVDAGARFIETATSEAKEAGVENVAFRVADVEATEFGERFDLAFSRMGTMFFANPVAAMRNVRKALEPGGRLCMVVWRRKIENEWVRRAEQTVERFVEEPEDSDEPTCGPGPFSMADADTTSQQLLAAGFEQVEFRRCDLPITMGSDMDEAVALVTALGPAGEVIRLAGEEAEKLRPKIEAALREDLKQFEAPDGTVTAPASTWIVSATVPPSPSARAGQRPAARPAWFTNETNGPIAGQPVSP